ncbi:hypothetical protein DBV15_02011 [Temnothorax longispinosus]|uniref:Uncharacterized protein n=1 Tax=Temnothorax longispinosus TaxID=300112 RepID=A0A4S2KJ33_9HYME|nr:hypothetical protein DBV15_02011 [Temnothorax longispinosus]
MPKCPEHDIDTFKSRSTVNRNTVVLVVSSIPIYLSIREITARCIERKVSTRFSRGIGESVARPERLLGRGYVLANGRPHRRRRRFCQARRSLRESHVNVRRAARKPVRRVESIGEARREVRARRHAPERNARLVKKRGAAGDCGEFDGVSSVESERRIHAAEDDRRREWLENGPQESSSYPRDKLSD